MARNTPGQSLFPLLGSQGDQNKLEDASQEKTWLKCSSFTVETDPQKNGEQWREHADEFRAHADALLSSDTDDSSEGALEPRGRVSKRKRRDHGKSRKKRRSDLDKIIALESKSKSRRSGTHSLQDLRMWMSNEALRREGHGGFAFDAAGCYENIAYESLYRFEIPKYARTRCISANRGSSDKISPMQGRFFSAKSMAKERSRKLKRFKIYSDKELDNPTLSLPHPSFLSFILHQECLKESDDQYVMRRTKEFNITTRERPFELHAWVQFAKFQDEATRLLRRKGLERTTAERKIAILERGLSFHPGAEDLVLLLLECVEHIEDNESVQGRWERVMASSPGSPRLWAAYIHWRKSQFGSFSVSSIDGLYSRALRSLSIERSRQARLGVGGRKLAEIEQGLAILALSSVHFDAQSGYTEIAVMKIQCMLEWLFFKPNIPEALLHGSSLRSMFQKFWDKHAPRIGEVGSRGWGKWAEKELGLGIIPKSLQQSRLDPDAGCEGAEEDDEDGWTGWVTVTQGDKTDTDDAGSVPGDSGPSDGGSESDESVPSEDLEEDEKELMAKLGMKLEEDMAKLEQQKEISPDVLSEWVKREEDRDLHQFLFRSHGKDQKSTHEEFEDICEWVFDLDSSSTSNSLLFGCLEFLGVNVDSEVSSNDPVLWAVHEQSEFVPWSIREYLSGSMKRNENSATHCSSEFSSKEGIFRRWFDLSSQRAQFVARLLKLLSTVKNSSVALCAAWIEAELAGADKSNKKCIQETCKKLLEAHQDSIPLWIAYGNFEASLGRYKVAKRVFDSAYRFLSVSSGNVDCLRPILAVHFAEMEISRGTEAARTHALHLLYHLAVGGVYHDAKTKSEDKDCDMTSAKRIYQERIVQAVRNQADTFDAHAMSWVIAGALFEELVHPDKLAGKQVSANTLRNVLESLPESARSQNCFLEILQTRLCRMLLDISQLCPFPLGPSPGEVRGSIISGLRIYGKSAALHCMLHISECQSNATGRLARYSISECEEHSSVLTNILALSKDVLQTTSRLQPVKLLEKALSRKESSSSPLLWILYLLLEVDRGAASSAKRVMLRAIRSCPWAKLIWKTGLDCLNGALGSREVGEYMDLMKNKGINLRTDVYEVLLERLEVSN